MEQLNYKSAGVDVNANTRWTKWIAKSVKENRENHGITHVGAIGGFAGAMKFPPAITAKIVQAMMSKIDHLPKTTDEMKKLLGAALDGFSLVACTDGVGTKTIIAEELAQLETLGYDLLAMSVNDMVVGGATPIAFLDYIGCHHIEKDGEFCYQPFIEGLIKACREVDVELVGGETAELSDNYTQFGSDLTGFALGIVIDADIPRNNTIKTGDFLLAMKSSGIHSNGYSLVRKIIAENGIEYTDTPQSLNGKTVAEAIMEPTRLYVNQALAANATGLVKGMAHITGGGLQENIERALPKGLTAKLDLTNMPMSDVFTWINEQGVSIDNMLTTFNMGYGFVFVASEESWDALEFAAGEILYKIGEVE